MIRRPIRTGFTRTDLLAAVVICCLTAIYGVAMIGCGGGDSANAKAIEELTKKTDELTRRVDAMEPAYQRLETAVTSARQTARRMQNGTQVRGIQQGMVLYAQGNKTFYPGLTSSGANMGKIDGAASEGIMFGAAAFDDANPTAIVYAIMMTDSYFTPEYAISPLDASKTKATPGPTPVTNANYSYALLKVTNKQSDAGRRTEWSDTQNSQAPIAGDRSKAIDPSMTTTSLHVATTGADSAHWQGSVVWNDNHVTFENTGKLKVTNLKIGRVHNFDSTDTDDLFSGAAVGKFDATTNALFAY